MMKLTKKTGYQYTVAATCITQPPPDVLAVDRGLRTILSTNKWGLVKLFDRELLPFLFMYDRF
ncbi:MULTISPECIES: hypothetical protein [Morganellaceae]|uniref:Uncharacterized protein n=2 Tax=Moellerella wisconsensis TaxID=158849 RepID=A0A9Q8Q4R9_9GAMM|nr:MULTISPECIES: hypothetical protein [Morganellaceae]UNH32505.1 hypothetical protein MNY72_17430 [Moellerella wisconsensis]